MLRVALFDIDGTLVARGDALNAAAWVEGFAHVGFPDARPEDVPHAGFTDRKTASAVLRFHGLAEDEINDTVSALLAHKDFALAKLIQKYGFSTDLRALRGVGNLVRLMSATGVACGLITGNTEFAAIGKIGRAGLDPAFFEFNAYGAERTEREELVGHALEVARERLPDLLSSEVVVIGDTPADVRSGKHHGTLTLGVATGVASYDQLDDAGPDMLLHDLAQPAAVLQALMGPLSAAA